MLKPYLLLLAISACLFPAHPAASQNIITSIAGNGITQYIGDGYPATDYSLADPSGLCRDKHHNLIISDFLDHRLRMLRNDTLFTLAGNGTPSTSGDGGQASAATFNNPSGVCSDTAGNLYVTEYLGDVVRKISAATGIITTVCGKGTGGFSGDGGQATAATLETPHGAAIDAAGNLYIPDFGNQRIRKVTAATGIISTIAGTGTPGFSGDGGPATAAMISYPTAVTIDGNGNILIADKGNNVIRKIDATTGKISTIAGTTVLGYDGDGGPASHATLNNPNNIFVDQHGNIFISDMGNNVVRKVETTGEIHTVAGCGVLGYTGDGGLAVLAKLNGPHSLLVDELDYLYIGDGNSSVIRKVSPGTSRVIEINQSPRASAFPNPSTGNFTLSLPGAHSTSQIVIYNAIGSLIYDTEFTGERCDLNITDRPAGTYLLRVITNKGSQTIRLVIQP